MLGGLIRGRKRAWMEKTFTKSRGSLFMRMGQASDVSVAPLALHDLTRATTIAHALHHPVLFCCPRRWNWSQKVVVGEAEARN